MALVVRAFPVRCDRSEVEAFVREIRERAQETRRFYASFGVRREAWFFQTQGLASYIIGVTEVDGSVEEKAEAFATTTDDFARWFQQRVLEMSGVDEREQPLGPVSEQIFDSTGGGFAPEATLAVRMYPLTRGADALREFALELTSREHETRRFYDSFEANETWFVQEIGGTPHAIAVASLKGDVGGNAQRFADSQEPFDAWFKSRVVHVTGVDPNATPLGPPTTQVFEFRA